MTHSLFHNIPFRNQNPGSREQTPKTKSSFIDRHPLISGLVGFTAVCGVAALCLPRHKAPEPDMSKVPVVYDTPAYNAAMACPPNPPVKKLSMPIMLGMTIVDCTTPGMPFTHTYIFTSDGAVRETLETDTTRISARIEGDILLVTAATKEGSTWVPQTQFPWGGSVSDPNASSRVRWLDLVASKLPSLYTTSNPPSDPSVMATVKHDVMAATE